MQWEENGILLCMLFFGFSHTGTLSAEPFCKAKQAQSAISL